MPKHHSISPNIQLTIIGPKQKYTLKRLRIVGSTKEQFTLLRHKITVCFYWSNPRTSLVSVIQNSALQRIISYRPNLGSGFIFQISLISNCTNFKLQLFQIWPISNFTNFKFHSFQISLISNFTNFKFHQFQISPISNFTNFKFHQFQISPISNFNNFKFWPISNFTNFYQSVHYV